jgi:hypothetical protein
VGISIQKTNAGIGIPESQSGTGPKNAGLHRFIPVPDWFGYG